MQTKYGHTQNKVDEYVQIDYTKYNCKHYFNGEIKQIVTGIPNVVTQTKNSFW